VSYYDYYQPEAYVPRSDTFIEKDSSINEQIDRMRHAATRATTATLPMRRARAMPSARVWAEVRALGLATAATPRFVGGSVGS
jgi:hypothetical protein